MILKISAYAAWAAFVAWALTICYLSSLSQQDLQVMPQPLLNYDKVMHAIAFAVGGICLAAALHRTTQWRGVWLFTATVVGIGLFGAGDELHQLFTPGRSGADFFDWVADMIGGSLAALFYCLRYGRSEKKPTHDIADSAGGPSSD